MKLVLHIFNTKIQKKFEFFLHPWWKAKYIICFIG